LADDEIIVFLIIAKNNLRIFGRVELDETNISILSYELSIDNSYSIIQLHLSTAGKYHSLHLG
jgi:hypothetical protein